MTEFIIAEFDRADTAHLARAALGRLQRQLALKEENLIVVTRDTAGRVLLYEPQGICDTRVHEMHETFWNTLVHLLVTSGTSAGADREAALARLAAIGIDTTCERCFGWLFRAESSALLVLIDEQTKRSQVLGVLNGFHGTVNRDTLIGDDRENWQRVLSGA